MVILPSLCYEANRTISHIIDRNLPLCKESKEAFPNHQDGQPKTQVPEHYSLHSYTPTGEKPQ